ncbi:peptidyl-tRNA hydrolase 2, mitochondrial-like [Antennarius striatus]|uniref:peptidyl-tRNA hydrolase 2, mitochondrial-like n=1 Tax=Antennarius striatus TaxID=241820 RepID=UPI0035B393B2
MYMVYGATPKVLGLGVAAGLGCGLFIGWYLRKRFFPTSRSVMKAMGNRTEDGEFKLVLVVRSDLKMSPGIMAAQCSQAALSLYKQAQVRNPEILQQWEDCGQPKVVVEAPNGDSLTDLLAEAVELGLLVSLIEGLDKTQIASTLYTVLGIGPGPSDLIDRVTRNLSLYRN